MNEQEKQERIIKAASIGFSQGLVNRGWNPEQINAAAVIYTDPAEGLAVKKAAARVAVAEEIARKAMEIRSQR